MEEKSILREGRNCWRITQSKRAAFLVDGAAYFSAFAAATEKAKKSILIIGWDIDSRTRLLSDDQSPNLPVELGDFLNAIVSRRQGLHVHLLGWDFAMVFAFEREPLPVYKLGWRTHHRVHFRLDGNHPVGASHHQKIVVIDDAVAFAGGLDLAIRRWDTPEHQVNDSRRVDPGGQFYSPFHDVQIMADGQTAAALGELARERWRRATGQKLSRPPINTGDCWPENISPDIENISLAISRTEPAYNGYAQIDEVRQLYLDSIGFARRFIYIENQYFTSAAIGNALAARLKETDGPEIIVVLPRDTPGWLQEKTMGILRARLIRELRKVDRFDRLRLYCPTISGIDGECIKVHSKVMVVDNTLLRIGSSNLNNRSMGLDTECDVALAAINQESVKNSIAYFRNRLLAEHLGTSPENVAHTLARRNSLIAAVESLYNPKRWLEPLNDQLPDSFIVPETMIVDPERPVEPEKLVAEFVPEEVRESADHWLLRNIILLLFLFGLAAAWRWTPLADGLSLETISSWTSRVSEYPIAPLAIIAVYLAGGLILVPVTFIIAATALSFEPWPSFIYSLIGCVLSAMLTYAVGRVLGRETVRRLAGPRLNRLNRRLVHRGLITIITLRAVPVAPFSIINMVAGAFHIRLRDLILGTLIGTSPGILAITIFTGSLQNAIRYPGTKSLVALAGLVFIIAAVALWFRRWLVAASGSSNISPHHNGD
ncbi:MAG TPA: VTT domain-containing protein [Acidiferrobacterales bacterium]|nr:VTT domain-containing protein [Acidiferrobacterales bacterium]